MSVSFPSRSTFSRSSMARGFSLVELLISISIIGIITATVLVKFTDFDSTTILKGTAYEVASSIREAQVLSISVLGASGTFKTTYGIHFEDDSSNYILFRDSVPPQNSNPYYDQVDLDNSVEAITTYNTTRGISVEQICVQITGAPNKACDIESLDISFRRPEFVSLYYVVDGGGAYDQTDLDIIEYATIKLKSDKGANVWNVTVGALGHISVIKE